MRRFASRLAAAASFAALTHAASAAEGMPQLDFKNPLTVAQVVWLAIIFAVLYILLSKWALPQVASVLEARAATIGADLEAARASKAEADAAVAEQTEATRRASATAQAQIAEAVAAANAAAAKQAAELSARLEEQLSDAERRIAAARAAALGALRDVARETTSAVILRLTGTAPNSGAVDHAVDAAMAARAA